jgi:hypothetical protein
MPLLLLPVIIWSWLKIVEGGDCYKQYVSYIGKSAMAKKIDVSLMIRKQRLD